MRSRGIVVSIEGDKCRISVNAGAECMGCPSKNHCNMGEGKGKTVLAINKCGAEVSDHVIFESDPSKVLLSSFLIWILPIISMFIGYFIVNHFAQGIWPILASLAFLFSSFFVLKLIDKAVSGGTAFYPVAIEKTECFTQTKQE
jgi:sigma-E factor negative regulatory protein RseC